jgi:hypothetical protein
MTKEPPAVAEARSELQQARDKLDQAIRVDSPWKSELYDLYWNTNTPAREIAIRWACPFHNFGTCSALARSSNTAVVIRVKSFDIGRIITRPGCVRLAKKTSVPLMTR